MNSFRPLPEHLQTYWTLLAQEVFLTNICKVIWKRIYINKFLLVRGQYQYKNYGNETVIGQLIFVFSYER